MIDPLEGIREELCAQRAELRRALGKVDEMLKTLDADKPNGNDHPERKVAPAAPRRPQAAAAPSLADAVVEIVESKPNKVWKVEGIGAVLIGRGMIDNSRQASKNLQNTCMRLKNRGKLRWVRRGHYRAVARDGSGNGQAHLQDLAPLVSG